MATYTASILSEGNHVFPPRITLDALGVTITFPGIVRQRKISCSYRDVSSISISTPLVGFSTIHIGIYSEVYEIHGFLQSDAESIKRTIQAKKNR